MPRLAVAGLAVLVLSLGCGRPQVAICDRPLPPDARSKPTNCADMQVSTDRRTYSPLHAVTLRIAVTGHVAFVPCRGREELGPCGQLAVQLETDQGATVWKNELFPIPCAAPLPSVVGEAVRGEVVSPPLTLYPGVYGVVGQPGTDVGRSYFRVC
jgi:hypothetical protein